MRRFIALPVAIAALTSCSAPPPAVVEPVELTFASWVFISPEQQAFMDDVEETSGGTIAFAPIENWTEPDGVEKLGDEFTMAQAIIDGEIDAGWTSTRSFPAIGIDGFRAIEAPFVIQNPAGLEEIISGPIGEAALAAFDGSGLTPLSIYPGTLRFPLTAGHPLLEPADWAGKEILYYAPTEDSVQARTVQALGGTPVATGLHIIDDLNDDLYGGGADSLGDIAADGATARGPYPTSNVILWPTVLFSVINTAKFESLHDSQRAALTAAAQRAAEAVATVEPSQSLAGPVCSTSARFGTSTPGQLAALRDAVRPVYDWLEDDPAEAALLSDLQDIANAHPDPDIVNVPDGCAWDPAVQG